MSTARRAAARMAAACLVCASSMAVAGAVEIHPAGPEVPENLLRIELRFDRPQRLPFDSRRLALLDARGDEIPRALLDLTLPSSDGRRLTVLLDPGRVKRDVGPNVDAGRALVAGETVSLRVLDEPPGRAPTVKTWHVAPALSRPLEVEAWRWRPPRAGSREALVVDLRAPISSTGEVLIAVLDGSGRRVAGRTALGPNDAQWRFVPAKPWRREAYRVVAHPDLEDPAGNRRCAAFETLRASAIRCEEAGAGGAEGAEK
jgi:hypothetical protein